MSSSLEQVMASPLLFTMWLDGIITIGRQGKIENWYEYSIIYSHRFSSLTIGFLKLNSEILVLWKWQILKSLVLTQTETAVSL